MPKKKYGRAHQVERQRWADTMAEHGYLVCTAKRCLMRSRIITTRMRWHLGHNEAGTVWTGPEHERCNTSEGASRGNRTRGRRTPRPPKRRHIL